MDRVRVGIVGAGFAAGAHIEALRRLPGIEPVAIAASSPDRSRAAAERFGILSPHADYSALIAAPDVDAVHNCAPNFLHAEINKAVLSAGKHLLSEKPLGLSSSETRELARLAGDSGVVTGVCHNYRHFPLVRQAKEILASGEHGAPHFIHGSYLQDWLLFESDWNWRLEARQSGESRTVADIGSHWLDLAQFVTGSAVVRVCARALTVHKERIRPAAAAQTFASAAEAPGERMPVDTEDLATVLLEFDGGALGCFSVSQVSPGRKNRLQVMIDTPLMGITWDQEDPNRLWLGRRDAANSVLFRDPSLLEPAAARLAHYPAGHEEGWPDGLKNLMDDYYATVAARRQGKNHAASFATFADAHQVTLVVEAIVQSDRTRGWIDVEAEVVT